MAADVRELDKPALPGTGAAPTSTGQAVGWSDAPHEHVATCYWDRTECRWRCD